MKVTNSKQLSAYIKDIRLNQKQSQTDTAKKVGIRQDTISSFELNPDSTKLNTLFKILSALNLELEVKVRNSTLSEQQQGNSCAASINTSDSKWKEEW
ncbi:MULTISPECIES: helix-turn-helix domain-containing protein [unclassified Paraglaciecola]|uniref:helix-turn-helix domain-containing protein n=1 Tax=unclassified Paraglaciecola TaxID=2685791 RepID=UPI00131C448B|nr:MULTISPECIES: helix-turn-helix domain-containing protein [unclassified Paraglaciecola]|tara:strand:+ start:162 stop:455 length:294 start_codon:yes stop_codon:yes gene_type:complete